MAAVSGTYQLPPLFRNGTDVHGIALNHIQEPYLGDCNGADHMNPPEIQDKVRRVLLMVPGCAQGASVRMGGRRVGR